MQRKQRAIHTRGSSAETPNWRFGVSLQLPRQRVPELCEGLTFIALDRYGGCYYYPAPDKNKMAVAFEWYLPYRRWRFGYKVGVEFWVDEGNLGSLGAYVLYGEDHPRRGSPPKFPKAHKAAFQKNVIDALNLALNWRSELHPREFYTVQYLELPGLEVLRQVVEVPKLRAYLLPSVLLGRNNTRVSPIIQVVKARFKEEAKQIAGQGFARICALLTLASGQHWHSHAAQVGRKPLRQFIHSINPLPTHGDLYPRGSYRVPDASTREVSQDGFKNLANHYCHPNVQSSDFDDCLFGYYTAKDLLQRKFPTLAVVALVAALKLFRGARKCPGSLNCSNCGPLEMKHDAVGEAKALANGLASHFGLGADEPKRADVEGAVKAAYQKQRSPYVHDAILRHGEFNEMAHRYVPTATQIFSEELRAHENLLTLEFLARRALLSYAATTSGSAFDPSKYGIEPDKFTVSLRGSHRFTIPANVFVGIRA